MSLINEALKKAQPERSGTPGIPSGPNLPPTPPQPSGKRRRSYLWGFILAVLIVGLFSAMLSTYFVYQILGEETAKTAKPEPVEIESPEAAPGPVREEMPVAEAVAVSNAVPQESVPLVAEAPQALEPVPTVEDPAPPVVVEEAPPPAPAKPNPAIWARLQELEIRGIMSGGEKVLVFDISTSKTKSYKPGDIVDGSLGLSIASIESDAILFKDYGGIIHTKPF